MEAFKSEGQRSLIEKVINKGICVQCGACVGLCPYFNYFDGKVVVMDQCYADVWRCLQICPKADYEGIHLERKAEGVFNSEEVGPFIRVVIARAVDKDIRNKAQYGGTVSSLIIFSLEKGIIKSAVLTDKGGQSSPGGRISQNRTSILDCAQSIYSASGSLSALNRAISDGQDKIGVVGLPCQMDALARIKLAKPDGEERSKRIAIKIGLFCTWALEYRGLEAFLNHEYPDRKIKKFDISPPPSEKFCVQTETGWIDIPLDSVKPFIQKGCTICRDMTAEKADLSVGTVEGREGWNTVIVRTNAGDELINAAEAEGWLELDELPEENFIHLKEAALNKQKRALSNMAVSL
ncbi:MAG TPA: Coenzyme F420 hydrogenase/dehydrogenase, beta subunit C-terminal domain [Desulfobacteraceae bacterium]|nr:Coenzyme F420 hydrogenase/dehydrogenase, beta subunit C-terminal domain [Desulfobacteraceae bacterium]HPJ66185.1 Coenzyme F420 hydrogenase/dehydrogenase, beta subunit C-terminal domain [Desulfobacteraceae bacterium]HPQ27081.1 Coenzyme F420 hydrogenase/dehydrogenase, beta subunit C-terminal domain [Desulfobacteraceae bacterium]